MTTDIQERIELGEVDPLLLLGSGDCNLRAIQSRYPVRVVLRNGALTVIGDREPVRAAVKLLGGMLDVARQGQPVDATTLARLERGPEAGRGRPPAGFRVGSSVIRARTAGQASYLDAIQGYDVVFCIGPAGTGKTYLAVAAAAAALQDHQVERILLVRPAVEAGESLGFLPGDYREKVDPYLRPLYDALGELMPPDRVRKLIEVGVIEIAPLAYMRGRTLNRAFVILDEGQNTTVGQMKMFLTRLGPASRAVITGDITQVDLDDPARSGLIQIQSILAEIDRVAFVYLGREDVVRHRLVRDIIRAFEEHQERDGSGTAGVDGAGADRPGGESNG